LPRGAGGQVAPRGKYTARLVYKDADKREMQSEEIPFVRDTVENQRTGYGEIEGMANLKGGLAAENAQVELVDHEGKVVQRAMSTAAGKYLFKGVDGGDYKVRIAKKGFHAVEKPVSAKKAEKANADLELE
jgi:hypothetical protein